MTNNQLTPVQRVVAPPAAPLTVLNTMLAGPTAEEEAQDGIWTAIPENVHALSVSGPSNQVTVNMNTAFGQIIGLNGELAVAQIVATIAAQSPSPLALGVLFEIDGVRTSVPIADGQDVEGPVTLAQVLPAGT